MSATFSINKISIPIYCSLLGIVVYISYIVLNFLLNLSFFVIGSNQIIGFIKYGIIAPLNYSYALISLIVGPGLNIFLVQFWWLRAIASGIIYGALAFIILWIKKKASAEN